MASSDTTRRRRNCLTPIVQIRFSCTDEDLQLRLFVPLFVSACELIEKQVVAGTDDVRAALIRGLGCRRLAADLPGWGRSLAPGIIDDWAQRLALTAPNRSAMDQLLAE